VQGIPDAGAWRFSPSEPHKSVKIDVVLTFGQVSHEVAQFICRKPVERIDK
jgi:hypothetical protein